MDLELETLFRQEDAISLPLSTEYRAEDGESYMKHATEVRVSPDVLLLGASFHRAVASSDKSHSKAEIAACLIVAAKVLEGWGNDHVTGVLEHFGFKPSKLAASEWTVCQKVGWHLYLPGSISFLRHFSHDADGWNRDTRTLAKTLLTCLVLDPDACSHYRPSTQAAAALYLAKVLAGNGSWTKQHETVCRARERDLKSCARRILDAARKAAVTCARAVPEEHSRLLLNR